MSVSQCSLWRVPNHMFGTRVIWVHCACYQENMGFSIQQEYGDAARMCTEGSQSPSHRPNIQQTSRIWMHDTLNKRSAIPVLESHSPAAFGCTPAPTHLDEKPELTLEPEGIQMLQDTGTQGLEVLNPVINIMSYKTASKKSCGIVALYTFILPWQQVYIVQCSFQS